MLRYHQAMWQVDQKLGMTAFVSLTDPGNPAKSPSLQRTKLLYTR